jgi:hypothetical protein
MADLRSFHRDRTESQVPGTKRALIITHPRPLLPIYASAGAQAKRSLATPSPCRHFARLGEFLRKLNTGSGKMTVVPSCCGHTSARQLVSVIRPAPCSAPIEASRWLR